MHRFRNALRLAATMTLVVLTTSGKAATDPRASIADRLLAAHNAERETAGLPPMAWDRELERRAQAWADHLAADHILEHHVPARGAAAEGENLWAGTAGYFSPDQMVGGWIAEKPHFINGVFPSISTDGHWEHVGHYSQLMWRNTRRIGCATARSGQTDYLVCRYQSAGNIYGERAY